MKKTAVIGAGAMGILFGGKLAETGNDITMIDVVPAVIDSINQNGIIIEENGQEKRISVPARRAEEMTEAVDLVILFTKTLYSRSALESAKGFIGRDTYVMTLQNGLGNEELIQEFTAQEKIIVGVTNYNSDVKGPGRISTQGEGYVKFMSADGKHRKILDEILAMLNDAGFQAEITQDVFEAIWEKAAFNAAVNSTTALCRLPLGAVGSVEEGRLLTKRIAEEAAMTAEACGIRIDPEKIVESIAYAFQAHRDHYPSMAQDVLAHRKTEARFINGEIVKRAKQKGIHVPFTEAVYDLLRVVEDTYDYRAG